MVDKTKRKRPQNNVNRLKPLPQGKPSDFNGFGESAEPGEDSSMTLVESDDDFEELFQGQFACYSDAYIDFENDRLESLPLLIETRKRDASVLDGESFPKSTDPMEEDTIPSLVDAAIRVSILRAPGRLGPGIRILKSAFVRKLADVSPMLWNHTNLAVKYLHRLHE
jgi:hypothetical protein